MVKKLFFLTVLSLFILPAFGQLKSPDEFLPHKVGEEFTPHHLLVDYMEHVAANSPNVILTEYGQTNQKRPLLLLAISSEENLGQLEEIRKNNLRKTGLLEGAVDPKLDRAIVWLSFSVHGNESAGSESSMPIIYELVRPGNAQTRQWLQNTVILFDPSINPDGLSRFANWNRDVSNRITIPETFTREHDEPWPRGRYNHYLFDLNRDWAWQTQVESQQRIKAYHQWMPHMHVDFHEMGANSTYYFAPASRPYHPYITQWQRDFQVEIGKNNARYFDQNGWLYFTKEVYDLFYPSYGDTYPIFNGAIGMTYEQARGNNKAVLLENGDTLTLKDRVAHHFTAALSTVEVASNNVKRLNENFEAFYKKAVTNPTGEYKTYIIKGHNYRGRLEALIRLLDKNHIQYGRAGKSASVSAYDYQTGKTVNVTVDANDLLISAFQPKSVLTQVLFDPSSFLEDSLTYDITAWSLPYAYGVESYATKQRLDVQKGYSFGNYANNLADVERPYAYIASWSAMNNARFLSALLKEGVKVRYASGTFRLEGQSYAPGTLVITRADNRKTGDRFDRLVASAAQTFQQEVRAVRTGFAENGSDLGSGVFNFIEPPKVVVLSGEATSANSFGQIWYYFEQDIHYPVYFVDAGQLARLDLSDFNLLILPEGRYNINESLADKLNTWIAQGGRLIAVSNAVSSLEDQKGFALTRYATREEKSRAEKALEEELLANRLKDYAEEERRFLSTFIPGAIFKLKLDPTHPLAFGLGDSYFSLKTNSLAYQHLKDAWNVGTLNEEFMVSGFAGQKAREELKNTTTFAVQDKGRGAVIYLIDNPLYRSFWESGKFLFSNAVFLTGQ